MSDGRGVSHRLGGADRIRPPIWLNHMKSAVSIKMLIDCGLRDLVACNCFAAACTQVKSLEKSLIALEMMTGDHR